MGHNEILFLTMLMGAIVWAFYKLLTDKIETGSEDTQHDAKTRFESLASKGDKKRGLELLDKLDQKTQ